MAYLLCFVITLMLASFALAAEDPAGNIHLPGAAPGTEKMRKAGEGIYLRGVLPSGEPVHAVIHGDIPVAGTAFTCVSCHQRSGIGSTEGSIFTPPTNGSNLFKPLKALYKGFEITGAPPRRPAYTDASLADLIRSGIDPVGRTISEAMPRYLLGDEGMAQLIAYLKSLSSVFSPGVSEKTIRFATVIAGDVSPEDRDAMLKPLEAYVNAKNQLAHTISLQRDRTRSMAESMLKSRELAYRSLSLSRWILTGPPDTWRSQLEEYYRREPVFGLLGGMATGAWKPVHDFSETYNIPSLFPLTDFPVVSDTDWYTLYFSKGYFQEGEAAARYLSSRDTQSNGGGPLQIIQASDEGAALAGGFQRTWQELGHKPPVTITLNAGEPLTGDLLQKVLAGKNMSALLLWVDASALPVLESLAVNRERPEMVFVSSDYCGKSLWTLNEQVRKFTYITYPYGLSPGTLTNAEDMTGKHTGANKIAQQTNALLQVLTLALMDMSGNYYRDYFLDVIGMIKDQTNPLYERLSFGPGQRYASKGCYIVQLSEGPSPEIIRRSDWVIH